MQIAHILSDKEVGVFLNGSFRFVKRDSDQGKRLIAALRKPQHDLNEIAKIADLPGYLAVWSSGRVEVGNDDTLRLDGEVVDFGVSAIIQRMIREGENVEPLARFLEKVALNPDKAVAPHIYSFINRGVMPITPEGDFLAFKRVRDDYLSFRAGRETVQIIPTDKIVRYGDHSSGWPQEYIYTAEGNVPHKIGTTIQMHRLDCDPNRDQTCSVGLHACSHGYLGEYHEGRGRIIVVKINPTDVTAIPSDYNDMKLRCCRLEVVSEVEAGKTASHFARVVDKRYQPQGWQDHVIEPEIAEADPFIRSEPAAFLVGHEDGCEHAGEIGEFECVISKGDHFDLIVDEVKFAYAIGFVLGYTENFELDEFHSERAVKLGKEDGAAAFVTERGREDSISDFDPSRGERYHTIPNDHDEEYAYGFLHELARLTQVHRKFPTP